ncbi:DUF2149 domain-containing protein [Galbitalea sp. SE-J8]|uniref:DUF2149 domain-containing protein n=1 Tax=Galbitalea sp. SE-J8 TaxID=3054952 RepID=UPI00259D12B8|nr:DUF2149 domain-containing protein [Galbitalea sp. SE-J8]MDM4762867.1 DUF2149 domain-containing protein [Galbitalea sp. SE-J8]
MTPRSRRSADRAGDPLDGLVNLFDVGIVLAVAFLIAALSSLNLSPALIGTGVRRSDDVVVQPGQKSGEVPDGDIGTVVGEGDPVGTVYRLTDGRLVYVTDPTPAPARTSPDGG